MQDAQVSITVLGAIALPERKGLAGYAGMTPFCRLKLGSSTADTSHGSGRNPTWAVTKRLQWPAGISELTVQVYDDRLRKPMLIASGAKHLNVPANRTKWDETVYLHNNLHSGSGGQVQLQMELTLAPQGWPSGAGEASGDEGAAASAEGAAAAQQGKTKGRRRPTPSTG
ncbi:hypothetical protein WJX73_010133 [Symbiochloris irregularis]|uniref:C2 domain-containing protein n=1 Tax=Symbiochloris irregularis TaxID=706552 RepID=A0AAW1PVG2_9CHLO